MPKKIIRLRDATPEQLAEIERQNEVEAIIAERRKRYEERLAQDQAQWKFEKAKGLANSLADAFIKVGGHTYFGDPDGEFVKETKENES